MAVRAHSLANCHLEDLTTGDLAFCLRQGIAVSAVAGRTLDLLVSQPLLQAEAYAGDLLAAAIHAEGKGWLSANHRAELRDICSSAVAAAATVEQDVLPLAEGLIRRHDAT